VKQAFFCLCKSRFNAAISHLLFILTVHLVPLVYYKCWHNCWLQHYMWILFLSNNYNMGRNIDI